MLNLHIFRVIHPQPTTKQFHPLQYNSIQLCTEHLLSNAQDTVKSKTGLLSKAYVLV